MTNIVLNLAADGTLAVGAGVATGFAIDLTTHSFLGDNVELEVSFAAKNAQALSPENVSCKLLWRDALTDDVIYQVEGLLLNDEDNTSTLISRIYAMGIVSNFTITIGASFAAAVAASDAYNAYGTVARLFESLPIPTSAAPAFNEESAFQAIITADVQPSYLALPDVEDIAINNLMLRAMDKLNIPLDVEIDPTLTVDTAITTVESLGFSDHRVQVLWNPNLARPRDAVSLHGRKTTFGIIGQYLGKKLARNARTTAQGIPPIHTAIAGADYPLNARGMEQRPDITLGDDELERLAIAKINVVRRIRYSIGTFFVVSDGLTQYNHKTSALRLVNSAEITVYTENALVEILHRHMLKTTTQYLKQASQDIQRFLDACVAAGLLVAGKDTGVPYSFRLTPDENYPFERVRLEFSRCPEGMVRSVIFDSVVTK